MRELFIRRVWAHFELQKLEKNLQARPFREQLTMLQEFHRRFKYFMMEFEPARSKSMGNMLGQHRERSMETLWPEYRGNFISMLQLPVTLKKRINVIYHIFGYFKHDLGKSDKMEFLKLIQGHARGHITYQTILKLLNFMAWKFRKEYLLLQHYFCPYPEEFGLMKSVGL